LIKQFIAQLLPLFLTGPVAVVKLPYQWRCFLISCLRLYASQHDERTYQGNYDSQFCAPHGFALQGFSFHGFAPHGFAPHGFTPHGQP
jgi:hypothetical protein